MLGPLLFWIRQNREKLSFHARKQGFEQPAAVRCSGKAAVPRHFSSSKPGIPCYWPDQGPNSAEQGVYSPPTGDLIAKQVTEGHTGNRLLMCARRSVGGAGKASCHGNPGSCGGRNQETRRGRRSGRLAAVTCLQRRPVSPSGSAQLPGRLRL